MRADHTRLRANQCILGLEAFDLLQPNKDRREPSQILEVNKPSQGQNLAWMLWVSDPVRVPTSGVGLGIVLAVSRKFPLLTTVQLSSRKYFGQRLWRITSSRPIPGSWKSRIRLQQHEVLVHGRNSEGKATPRTPAKQCHGELDKFASPNS